MRLQRLKKELSSKNKYPYLIQNLTNIKYLTGFDGSYANLIVDENDAFFITDSRYEEYAGKLLPSSVELVVQQKDIFASLQNILKKIKKKKLFVETLLPYTNFVALKESLKDIKVIAGGDEVSPIRMVKDGTEIEILRKAVDIADKCFSYLLTIIKPGVVEWDISAEIEYFFRKNGCRKSSFDSVVASNKGSSMPHYKTSMTRKIENGDIVLIDMGCEFNGYNSDLTRTVFVNNIEPEFERIYNVVRTANEKAIAAIKPGTMTGTLDKIAREVISKEGYGKLFGHALGHGVGLDIHEMPAIKTKGNIRIKKNMAFTIEPGIYIPGKGGVRIEDIVIATQNGYEVLTKSPKEIIII